MAGNAFQTDGADWALVPVKLGSRRFRLDLLLVLIVLAGSLWRLNGLDWGWTDFDPTRPGASGPGRFYAFHPDEASNIRAARLFTESDSWRPTGELYGEKVDYSLYGATTIYLHTAVVKVAAALGGFTPFDEQDPRSFRNTWLVVRWLTALLGLACIPLLYWAALTLYGLGTARLAALLLAGSAFHAQSGRFGTVDMPMVVFILWSFAHSARLLTRDRVGKALFGTRLKVDWDLVLAALAAGLAVSTKINAALVALPLIAAELLRDPLPGGTGARALALLRRLFGWRLVGAGLGVLAVFFLLNPYAILDWRNYLFADHAFGLVHILRNVRGEFYYPFQIQFQDISPFAFLLGNVLWWAAGPALLITALVALPWLGWRHRPGDLALLVWVVPGLLLTGGAKVLFMRYALPFLPLLALLAAILLMDLLRLARARGNALQALAWLAVVAVALPSLGWTAALASVHNQEDSRLAAGRWLASHLPQGSALLHERSANSIKPVIHMPRYHNVCMEIPTVYRSTGATEAEKLDFLGDRLRQVDWAAILEANRKLGYDRCSQYPAERRFYEELFAGRLGFVTDTVFQSLPQVLGVKVDDQAAEFSLRYYDHDEVHIFHKVDAAALAAGIARLKQEMAATPGTADAELARLRKLMEAGDLEGARSGATTLLQEADRVQREGDNRASGQAAALQLLAELYERSAVALVSGGRQAEATPLLQEADQLHGQAVQWPTAPVGMDSRLAAWLNFRMRVMGPEAARQLAQQALQAGMGGPALEQIGRDLKLDLGAATAPGAPPQPASADTP